MVSAAVTGMSECMSATTVPFMTTPSAATAGKPAMLSMTPAAVVPPSAAMTPSMTPVIMIPAVAPTVVVAPRMTPSVRRPVSVCWVSAAVTVATRIFNVVATLRRNYEQSERQSCQD
jgi:hypothetical protein